MADQPREANAPGGGPQLVPPPVADVHVHALVTVILPIHLQEIQQQVTQAGCALVLLVYGVGRMVLEETTQRQRQTETQMPWKKFNRKGYEMLRSLLASQTAVPCGVTRIARLRRTRWPCHPAIGKLSQSRDFPSEPQGRRGLTFRSAGPGSQRGVLLVGGGGGLQLAGRPILLPLTLGRGILLSGGGLTLTLGGRRGGARHQGAPGTPQPGRD